MAATSVSVQHGNSALSHRMMAANSLRIFDTGRLYSGVTVREGYDSNEKKLKFLKRKISELGCKLLSLLFPEEMSTS
jgi:hypothetical protein